MKICTNEFPTIRYYAYQMNALLPRIFLSWFGMAYELQLVSYSLKTISKDALHSHPSTSEASLHVFLASHI